MLSIFLKAKLHNLTITSAELNYQGSMTLDPDFMEAVGMVEFEKILIANLENGNRFETYAIAGERGSRVCCLNGATAHKGAVGDRVIVFSFCMLNDSEIANHKPRIAIFGAENEMLRESRI
ncbi:MAG: aspartate 1-decarboxylase [Lentisphaerae bacterium]|jgi:aspartate 1-decarboxylase|nr:aspartate 1-decarboxylase [Lentisphaerota bacterium]